jgi:DMSO/TMAO reductase YedYZ molybdopterin-dependent catalytic subunit
MKRISRRGLLTAGLAAGAGAGGYLLAKGQGLIPPDATGPWAPGTALTYAAHRLLGRGSMAREFAPHQISRHPFPNGTTPEEESYQRLQHAGFRDWSLTIDGLVARPATYSLAGLRALPAASQITQLVCEEGWSFIAQWTGVPLNHLLRLAAPLPGARYVAYYSLQKDWWDSLDLDEALHPQTLVAYGMNGAELPPGHGGPLRLRVPRQLGYKSVKFITRLTVIDDLKKLGAGPGSSGVAYGYSWYAGI